MDGSHDVDFSRNHRKDNVTKTINTITIKVVAGLHNVNNVNNDYSLVKKTSKTSEGVYNDSDLIINDSYNVTETAFTKTTKLSLTTKMTSISLTKMST